MTRCRQWATTAFMVLNVVLISAVTVGCENTELITRTWSATDGCANQSTCSQVITVTDTTPPVLSGVPGDATVPCDQIPVAATVTASDDCDPAPALSFNEDRTEGDFPISPLLFTLTRTWETTDACGNNSGSQSQVIK